MQIIITNGLPESGKDTFAYYCQNILKGKNKFGVKISSVDFVKKIALKCGWDGTKTPQSRKFLSDLKKLLTEWDDIPWKKVREQIDLELLKIEQYGFFSEDLVVFIDSREPDEIKRYVEEYGAITLLVKRDKSSEKILSNDSDKNVYDYKYDYVIENNSSEEELFMKAKKFIEDIL
jgi:hypothetical protein